jgi:hypothetical protein
LLFFFFLVFKKLEEIRNGPPAKEAAAEASRVGGSSPAPNIQEGLPACRWLLDLNQSSLAGTPVITFLPVLG